MLAARLATLRPALRTLRRPQSSKPKDPAVDPTTTKTTKAKDMVDPTTTSAWWKDWAGQNHQGFFNVGAAFFLTVLASQNYSGRLERAALQADLAAAQNEAAALRARAADDAAIADAAKRLWVKPAALRSEIERILDPPLVLPGPSETSPALV